MSRLIVDGVDMGGTYVVNGLERGTEVDLVTFNGAAERPFGYGRVRIVYADRELVVAETIEKAELTSKVLSVRVPVEIDQRLARREPPSGSIEARILRGIAHVLPTWIRLDVELESLDARLAVTIEDR